MEVESEGNAMVDTEGGARAVAMTISPRARSWETNSSPMPREAPTISQICDGISRVEER